MPDTNLFLHHRLFGVPVNNAAMRGRDSAVEGLLSFHLAVAVPDPVTEASRVEAAEPVPAVATMPGAITCVEASTSPVQPWEQVVILDASEVSLVHDEAPMPIDTAEFPGLHGVSKRVKCRASSRVYTKNDSACSLAGIRKK